MSNTCKIKKHKKKIKITNYKKIKNNTINNKKRLIIVQIMII